MRPEVGQQDLRTYLRAIWRWKFLFLAFLILIPLGVYFVEHRKPKIYQSSTLMELQDVSIDTGGSTSGPIQTGNLLAVARLVTTTPVATAADRYLHPPESPTSLLNSVSASGDTNTGFLTIWAKAHDPNRAAAIANAFASALAGHQTQQAVNSIDEQIRAAQRQLAATSRLDPGDRSSLGQQIARLRALKGASNGGTQVIERAVTSSSPVGPQTRRSVELAVVIGLLLGLGAVFLAENLDRRLRTPEDLERLTPWPLLGVIPATAFVPNHQTPRDEEALQMLSATLTYFNVDRPLSSVAVVSPLLGDGKTTVAVGLAVATARAGRRVALVDADLRRSQMPKRLGISKYEGVGTVLAGEQELEQVLLVQRDKDSPEGGRLSVLPAGMPPPNPAALLRSPKVGPLLRRLESMTDLVILDTAAALSVSDTIPLLRQVSGIVVVVRLNESSIGAVRRLKKVIEGAHGTVLGVVATGSEAGAGEYGQYYYYADRRRFGRDAFRLGKHRVRRIYRSRNGRVAPVDVASLGAGPAEEEEGSAQQGTAAERGVGRKQRGGGAGPADKGSRVGGGPPPSDE